jgi:hypothetical protein
MESVSNDSSSSLKAELALPNLIDLSYFLAPSTFNRKPQKYENRLLSQPLLGTLRPFVCRRFILPPPTEFNKPFSFFMLEETE